VRQTICDATDNDTHEEGEIDMTGRSLRWAALPAALLTFAVAALAAPAGPVQGATAQRATTLPPGFSKHLVVGGLVNPTDMEFAPDGRLFIAEQAGRVRVLRKDGTLATFLDIRAKVNHSGERGLLGIAFDPDFATNHFVYFDYTRKATASVPVHNRVVRVRAQNGRAGPGSERVLLELNRQTHQNHVAGSLEFGSGGRLYVASGENDTASNAQSLKNLLGKVLRINKDGTIPGSNPFFDRATGKNRAIWARGLRNPFKIAVKPGTGTLFINDVGEDTWEEINHGARGADYGWPVHEGPESAAAYVPPLFAYRHGSTATTGCAITGGTFYNPASRQFPKRYVGDYFFTDLCGGWVRRYDPATDTTSGFATGFDSSLVDLEVGSGGALYVLSLGGKVHKVRFTG
jgi:glucose/arabinose dehydrogenase